MALVAPPPSILVINALPLYLQYLGSTPILLTGTGSRKVARMHQAQEAVKLIKVGHVTVT